MNKTAIIRRRRRQAAGASGPVNTVAPAVTGTAQVGQTLTCSTGTWTGTGTITYAYQWLRDGATISGATSSTYTLVSADADTDVSCRVTATDDEGSRPKVSNAVSVTAPSFIDLASLFDSGTPEPGIVILPKDSATVWTDDGATSAASADDAIGAIDDKSPNANRFTQSSPSFKPILRNRGSEGWSLEYDGGDDVMLSTAVSGFDTVSTITFVGYVEALDAGGGNNVAWLLTNSTSGNGRPIIQAPFSSTVHRRAILTAGTNAIITTTDAAYAPPDGRVVRVVFSDSGAVDMWLDGVYIGQGTGTAATFTGGEINMGALVGTLNGKVRIGSTVIIGRALTSQEASDAEASIANDHGITFGAASAPSAFTSGDWSVASDGSTVTISTLPADGGSAITDIEYRVNSGTAVSLGQTTTGTYAITASGGDDVQIRAVNAVGAGAWSDTKTAIDADAATYIAAVEAADGQALEEGVVTAINDFVAGCKADGNWTALKASCILAGARTLNGALVPLVGAAPTNFNFVSADYNRKTGLKGDGATKYLDSNRNNNADPQNDHHLAAYVTEQPNPGVSENYGYLGAGANVVGTSILGRSGMTARRFLAQSRWTTGGGITASGSDAQTGFFGQSRSVSTEFSGRYEGITVTKSTNSATPLDASIVVFDFGPGFGAHALNRLSFYSIGTSVDLAALDARVSALMTALDGAIA